MGSSGRGNREEGIKDQKRGVTPGQGMSLLKKQGVFIDEKEAEKILDMMYFFANLIVNQQLDK